MSDIKGKYSAASTITCALDNLANGGTATSNNIDNSATLAPDYVIELAIAGTAAATAWLEVRVLQSVDGGSTWGTWESAKLLGVIALTATPQKASFSMVQDAGFMAAPEHFKIAVKNNTGAALSASGNVLKAQPTFLQVV